MIKPLVRALGYSFLTLLIVNLIYFIVALYSTDLSEGWSFAFKHGMFKINGELVGLEFLSPKANGIMGIVFFTVLLQGLRKKQVKTT